MHVRDIPVDHLVDRVAEGDVDLAIGPDRHTGESVISTPLFDSAWVLWCAPDHRLTQHQQAGFAEFLGDWIKRWSVDR